MNEYQKQKEMRDLVEQFEQSRDAIKTFFTENPQFLDIFIPLMDRYNETLAEAKQAVRNVEGSSKLSVGPFTRTARPLSKTYDATKVNPEVLAIPGVVKKIDSKVIDQLIVSGKISHADVEGGQKEEYGSARIMGPKEIVVKVV